MEEEDLYQEGWVAGLGIEHRISPTGKPHTIGFLYHRIRGSILNASISLERSQKRERNVNSKITRKRWNGRQIIQSPINHALAVREAIEDAPFHHRQILFDLYWNGLSTAEVADKYGLPHWRVVKNRRLALDWVIQFWGIK